VVNVDRFDTITDELLFIFTFILGFTQHDNISNWKSCHFKRISNDQI
jgi:hypothetical protein